MNLTSSDVIVDSEPKASAWSRHLQNGLGRFATGVAVVTVGGDHGPLGEVVSSFASVSNEPPLIMIAVGKSARVHDSLAGRAFAVNILGAEDRHVAAYFSRSAAVAPDWVQGDYAPRVRGVLAHVECSPWAAYDAGDRTLYVGRVEDFDYRRGDALGLIDNRYVVLPEQVACSEEPG